MVDQAFMEGGCLCGNTRYRVSGTPFASEYCHCSMCRKGSGAPVLAWMDYQVEQVCWMGEEPAQYASSEHVLRGFCVHCGSTLSFQDTRYPNYLTLTVGSLDDPNQVAPTYHIYVDDQVSWFRLDDELKAFPRGPEKD